MKYSLKIILILLLGYTLVVQGFKTLFEFFSKNKYEDFWLSFVRSDIPNIIIVVLLIYTIFHLVKDLIKATRS
jgi:uncharacterized membrane protein HdeD (DUF308 family)